MPASKVRQQRRRTAGGQKQASSESKALITSGSMTLNVLPRMYRARLRYAETFSLTTGAAGIVGTVQTMVLNSLFDPNLTGTGHQPYGFDQLTPFYQQYFVHAVKYQVNCNTLGGTAEIACCMQIFPTAGGVSIAGITTDAATEKSPVTVWPLGPSGVDRARSISGTLQLHKVFGLTPAQYRAQADQYGAAVTANPNLGCYLEVGLGSYSGTAGESASIQIVLDFDTEFWQPKTLPQS